MKIVVAPDSFKGSLSAKAVADAIETGVRKVIQEAEIVKIPMADGGEGTVESLVDATCGELVHTVVMDPLMREIEAYYGILGDGETAVIEMAAASGLPLLEEHERNPLVTTTYGTGQLIKDALDRGCNKMIIGIGGSATNDAGVGMLKALGVRFLDSQGVEVDLGGGALGRLARVSVEELDPRVQQCSIVVACDVNNPLVGDQGATKVFGRQKGATDEMVQLLESYLDHFGNVLKEQFGKEVKEVPGGGAAGGLGASLMAFMNAKLEPGIDIVIETLRLNQQIEGAHLVITGEGFIDHQTLFGKTPFGVAREASKQGIPVIAIAGGIGEGAEVLYDHGFNSLYSIVDRPMDLAEAIENSARLLTNTAERIMRTIMISID